jgi:type I restriction enzyme, R subunit
MSLQRVRLMPGQYTEHAFETAIEYHLTTVSGYGKGESETFDLNRVLFPEDFLAFIQETQTKEWEYLANLQKGTAAEILLDDLWAV